MKVTMYRLRCERDGHVHPLCAPCFNQFRAEALAKAFRAAGWVVEVEESDREVFVLPVEAPLPPVAPGPQPHASVWPAVGATEYDPITHLPDEPLMPIKPLVDPALIDREEELTDE